MQPAVGDGRIRERSFNSATFERPKWRRDDNCKEEGMMRRAWIIAVGVVALGLMPSLERAQDRASFQVGDATPAFDVVDVTGPNKGKQLCYV